MISHFTRHIYLSVKKALSSVALLNDIGIYCRYLTIVGREDGLKLHFRISSTASDLFWSDYQNYARILDRLNWVC